MSANPDNRVVAMPGFSVPRHQNEPISDVIEIAEEILALAKSGALRGIGAALVTATPQIVTETRLWSGGSPDRYCLIAAVSHLQHATYKAAWPNIESESTPNSG